jgi:hypothetical protein
MEKRFTPGPWMVYRGRITESRGISVLTECDYITAKNVEANTRLMSAAPELLEVLRKIMEPFKGITTENLLLDWQREARAAIEKATRS